MSKIYITIFRILKAYRKVFVSLISVEFKLSYDDFSIAQMVRLAAGWLGLNVNIVICQA